MVKMTEEAARTVFACPWYSNSDRERVYEELFSNDGQRQEMALKLVDAWKARNWPLIPLGVEVTAALIRTSLFDSQQSSEHSNQPDSANLRYLYSMALIRFVNLVTEVGQVMDYPLPITCIAKKMGVPEWIVDLRHAATHSNMPPLHVLRIAASFALQWTKVNYWDAEGDIIGEYYKSTNDKSILWTAKTIYKNLSNIQEFYRKVSFKEKLRNSKRINLKERADCLMDFLIRHSDRKEVVKVMMLDGQLFPTCQQVMEHMKFSEEKKSVVSAVLQQHSQIWLPILKVMVKHGFLGAIFEALVLEASVCSGVRRKLALSWIRFILKKFSKHAVSKKQRFNARAVISAIFSIPEIGSDVDKILTLIGCELPDGKRQQLKSMLSIQKCYTGRTPLPSVTDFHKPAVDDTMKSFPTPAEAVGDDLLRRYPLGMLPDQESMEWLALRLPDHVDNLPRNRESQGFLAPMDKVTENFIEDLQETNFEKRPALYFDHDDCGGAYLL